MKLIEVRATFECDGCGRQFSVEVDPAASAPQGWDMMNVAIDAVRGSVGYKSRIGSGPSSVQNDKCLCGDCTRKEDTKTPEPEPDYIDPDEEHY